MQNPELWARLQAFRFDADGVSAPYSAKLAEDQRWTSAYTERVIEEYRRFLYLTQVSAAPVTPSIVVDHAWHMHLNFTRSYWDDLCGDILGAPLHHDPCAGDDEMPLYGRQYEATLRLYQAEFGAGAPEDIWPIGRAPKAEAEADPQAWTHRRRTIFAMGLGFGLPGAICALGAMAVFGAGNWLILLLAVFFAMILVGVQAYPAKKGTREGGGGTGFVGGCGTSGNKHGASDAGGGDSGAGGCAGGGG